MNIPFTEIVNFTPGSALAGGLLIGGGAVLLLAGIGRIAGISGILHSLFTVQSGHGWRASFLLGLLGGAGVYVLLWPGDIAARSGFPVTLLIIAGLLVGVGTRLGSGCTSGHGVCGIGRRSKRSIVATALFMLTGVVAAVFLRHGMGITP